MTTADGPQLFHFCHVCVTPGSSTLDASGADDAGTAGDAAAGAAASGATGAAGGGETGAVAAGAAGAGVDGDVDASAVAAYTASAVDNTDGSGGAGGAGVDSAVAADDRAGVAPSRTAVRSTAPSRGPHAASDSARTATATGMAALLRRRALALPPNV